jgi:hypothetical protein
MAEQEHPEHGPHSSRYQDKRVDAVIKAFKRLSDTHRAFFRMFSGEEEFEDRKSEAEELKKRHEAFKQACGDIASALDNFIETYNSERDRSFNLGVLSALNAAGRFDLLKKFPDAEALFPIIEARALANKRIDEKGFEFIEYDPDEEDETDE